MTDDTNEMEERFMSEILVDFAQKTEDKFMIALVPLGDAVGWKAAVLTADGETAVSKASDPSWFGATVKAVARGLVNIEEYKERVKRYESEDAEDN